MAEKDSYIENVNMRNADNGVIINYTTRTKMKGKGTHDGGYSYDDCTEVFDFDDDDEESEEFEKAFDRFKELFMQARSDRKTKAKYLTSPLGEVRYFRFINRLLFFHFYVFPFFFNRRLHLFFHNNRLYLFPLTLHFFYHLGLIFGR